MQKIIKKKESFQIRRAMTVSRTQEVKKKNKKKKKKKKKGKNKRKKVSGMEVYVKANPPELRKADEENGHVGAVIEVIQKPLTGKERGSPMKRVKRQNPLVKKRTQHG